MNASFSSRVLITSAIILLAFPATAQEFTYNPPGQLVAGSGQGRDDSTVYVPGMRYPIENAPSFPNSQVWGVGGSQGPSGGQCDERNYSYPWWDNYCESRQWDMPLCPSGTGHQGQDIRPATCDDSTHWSVAAEDGTITSIGSYSVYLVTANGTQHRYLHMDMSQLAVSQGQQVTKGQRLGLVSNDFNGTPTTIHLHYDINQNVDGVGDVYVPTYMSLVESYEQLIGMPGQSCESVPAAGGIIDNVSRCFQLYGPSATWRFVESAGYDGSLYWTYGWTNDTPGNWARWQLEMEEGGEYTVEVYSLPEYVQSTQAPWRIRANGQEYDVTADFAGQTGWQELGTWTFTAGADQWVAVYDNSGEGGQMKRIQADAIRLTPVGSPMPDVEPQEDMGGDAGTDTMEPAPEDMGSDVGIMDPALGDTLATDAPGDDDATLDGLNQRSDTSDACGCELTRESPRGGAGWWIAALMLTLVTLRRCLPRPGGRRT